ncbi:MAG: hypothetical protein ISR65_03245 [Bacteriovoracaceae bacterium]|nr:hypothetical protein [Bacteriovoracaceae bacterium]
MVKNLYYRGNSLIVHTIIVLLTLATFISCLSKDPEMEKELESGTFGMRLYMTSGNNQTAAITTLYSRPLVVQVVTTDGEPMSGIEVNFNVVTSANTKEVRPTTPVSYTDENGFALTQVRSGTIDDIVFNITATVPMIKQSVTFELVTEKGQGDYDEFAIGVETSGFSPASAGAPVGIDGSHKLYGWSTDPSDQILKPDSDISPNPESTQRGRNFETAGETFNIIVYLENFEQNVCNSCGSVEEPRQKTIHFNHDATSSWTGQLSKLPDKYQAYTCLFVRGICVLGSGTTVAEIQTALAGLNTADTPENVAAEIKTKLLAAVAADPNDNFDFYIASSGITKMWVDDGGDLFDSTGVEILVEENLAADVVIADKRGMPIWKYLPDPDDPSITIRTNSGAKVYNETTTNVDRDPNEPHELHAAIVDNMGNFLYNLTDGTVTWSTSTPEVFSGSTYADKATTTLADPNDGVKFGTLFYQPGTKGTGRITLTQDANSYDHTAEFTVTPGIPHHLAARAISVSKDGNASALSNVAWAGALTPIEVSIRDSGDNICTHVSGTVPVKLTLDRYNLNTEKDNYADDNDLFPNGFFPSASGGYTDPRYNESDESTLAPFNNKFIELELKGVNRAFIDSGGTCSDTQFNIKDDCKSNNQVWRNGSCSDPDIDNATDCRAATKTPSTWTDDYNDRWIKTPDGNSVVDMYFYKGVVSGDSPTGLKMVFRDTNFKPVFHIEVDDSYGYSDFTVSGACDNLAYTTQADCEGTREVWTEGKCSGSGYYTAADCTSSNETWRFGRCSDASIKSAGTCTTTTKPVYTWTAAKCSKADRTSRETCEVTAKTPSNWNNRRLVTEDWADYDPAVTWVPDPSKSALNGITIYSGDPTHINIRKTSDGTNTPICQNGVYKADTLNYGASHIFTLDSCAGLQQSSQSPSYLCEGKEFSYCKPGGQDIPTSNNASEYTAYLEDQYGNLFDANSATAVLDPLEVSASWTGADAFDDTNIIELIDPSGERAFSIRLTPQKMGQGSLTLTADVGSSTWTRRDGSSATLNDPNITSSNTAYIYSQQPFNIELALATTDATDPNQYLVVKTYDKYNNWITAKDETRSIKIYMLTRNGSTRPAPAPDNDTPWIINNTNLLNDAGKYLRDPNTYPFPTTDINDPNTYILVDANDTIDGNNSWILEQTYTKVIDTRVSSTKEIYRIPINLPRANQDVWFAASMQVLLDPAVNGNENRIAYSSFFNATMLAGDINSLRIKNDIDSLADYDYSDTTVPLPPTGCSNPVNCPTSKEDPNTFLFTADQTAKFCMLPYDSHDNYCERCITNGSGSFSSTIEARRTPGLETSDSFEDNIDASIKKYIYKSSILHRSSFTDDLKNCADINFNSVNQIVLTNVPDNDGNLLDITDNRAGQLLASWSSLGVDGNTETAEAIININLKHGVYSKIKFPPNDADANDFPNNGDPNLIAGATIPINSICLYDSDDNLLEDDEGDGNKILYFKFEDANGDDTTSVTSNTKPNDSSYSFSNGCISNLPSDSNSFRATLPGDSYVVEVGTSAEGVVASDRKSFSVLHGPASGIDIACEYYRWIPGSCSNSSYLTKGTCEGNSAIWTAAFCQDRDNNTISDKTTQSACESTKNPIKAGVDFSCTIRLTDVWDNTVTTGVDSDSNVIFEIMEDDANGMYRPEPCSRADTENPATCLTLTRTAGTWTPGRCFSGSNDQANCPASDPNDFWTPGSCNVNPTVYRTKAQCTGTTEFWRDIIEYDTNTNNVFSSTGNASDAYEIIGALSNGAATVTFNNKDAPDPGNRSYNFAVRAVASEFNPSVTDTETVEIIPSDPNRLTWDPDNLPRSSYLLNSTWSDLGVLLVDQYGNTLWNTNTSNIALSVNIADSNTVFRGTKTKQLQKGNVEYSDLQYLEEATTDANIILKASLDPNGGILPIGNKLVVDESGATMAIVVLPGQTYNGVAADLNDAVTGTPNDVTVGQEIKINVLYVNAAFGIVSQASLDAIPFAVQVNGDKFEQTSASNYTTEGNAVDVPVTIQTASEDRGFKHTIKIESTICGNPTDCVVSSEFTVNRDPNNHELLIQLPGQITMNQGQADSNLVFDQDGSVQTAAVEFEASVYITDKYHNIVYEDSSAGIDVEVSNDPNAIITVDPNGIQNGEVKVKVTTFKASSIKNVAQQQLRATCTSNCLDNNLLDDGTQYSSNSYEVIGSDVSNLVALFPSQTLNSGRVEADLNVRYQNALSNQTANLVACEPNNTLDVIVTDQYYNRIFTSDYDSNLVSITITDSDNVTLLADDANFVDGKATFNVSPKKATTHSIAIPETLSGVQERTPPDFTVSAAEATKIVLQLPGETFNEGIGADGNAITSSTPLTVTAGVAFDVNVIATDACYNKSPLSDTRIQVATLADAPDPNVYFDGNDLLVAATTSYKAASGHKLTPSVIEGNALDALEESNFYTVIANSTGARPIVILPGQSYNPGQINQSAASAITGTPSSQVAGSSFQATMRVVDQYYNTIVGSYATSISLTDPNGTFDPNDGNSNTTTGIEVYDVVNILADSSTITATVDGNTSGAFTSSNYNVSFADANQTIVILPGQTHVQGKTTIGSAITGTVSSTLTAGTDFNVTIKAVDVYYNTISSFNGSYQFTSSDNNPNLPPIGSFSSGEATVSYRDILQKTGKTITLTETTLSNNTSSSFNINAADANKLLAILPGQSLVSGQTSTSTAIVNDPNEQTTGSSFDVNIVLVDQYYNIVDNDSLNVGVDLTSTDSFASVIDPNNFTLSNGITSIAVTNNTANTHPSYTSTRSMTPEFIGTEGYERVTSSTYNVRPSSKKYLIAALPGETLVPGAPDANDALDGNTLDQETEKEFTINIYGVDDRFNVIEDDTNAVETIASDANDATFDPNVPISFTKGIAAVKVTNTTAGNNKFLVFTSSAYPNSIQSSNYNINTSDVARFIVLIGDQVHNEGVATLEEAITLDPNNIVAGTPFKVVVKAVDSAYNTVATFEQANDLSFTFVGASKSAGGFGPNVVSAGDRAFTSGELTFDANFILYKAGETPTLMAISSETSGTSRTINSVQASTLDHLKIMDKTGGDSNAIEVAAQTVSTSDTNQIQMFAATYDKYGNFLTDDPNANWSFTSVAGDYNTADFEGNDLTLVSSVTLNTRPGTINVSTALSYDSNATDQTGNIVISENGATSYTLTRTSDPNAGENVTFTLTAVDADGNTATDYSGVKQINITSNAGSGQDYCGADSNTLRPEFDSNQNALVYGNDVDNFDVNFTDGNTVFTGAFKKQENGVSVGVQNTTGLLSANLATALNIRVSDPNCLQLRSVSGGEGSPLADSSTLKIGESINAYAAAYDNFGNFVTDENDVVWSNTDGDSNAVSLYTISGAQNFGREIKADGLRDVDTNVVISKTGLQADQINITSAIGDKMRYLILYPGQSLVNSGVGTQLEAVGSVDPNITAGEPFKIRLIAVDYRFYALNNTQCSDCNDTQVVPFTVENGKNSRSGTAAVIPGTELVQFSYDDANNLYSATLDSNIIFYNADPNYPTINAFACVDQMCNEQYESSPAPIPNITAGDLTAIKILEDFENTADPGNYDPELATATYDTNNMVTTDLGDNNPKFMAKGYDTWGNYKSDPNANWSTDSNSVVLRSNRITNANFTTIDWDWNQTTKYGDTIITARLTSDTNITDSTGALTLVSQGASKFLIEIIDSNIVAGNNTRIRLTAQNDSNTNATNFSGTKQMAWDTSEIGTDLCETGESQLSPNFPDTLTFTSGQSGDFNVILTVAGSNKSISALEPFASDSNNVTISPEASTSCLRIRSAASGGGSILSDTNQVIDLDDELSLFAAGYDKYGNFMSINPNWLQTGVAINTLYPFNQATSSNFVGVQTGSGTIALNGDTNSLMGITVNVGGNSRLIMNNTLSCGDSQNCLANNSVSSSFYWDASDPNNDSWRNSSSATWYTEAASSVRGTRDDFPTHAYIVGSLTDANDPNQGGALSIIDAKTNKLFLRATSSSDPNFVLINDRFPINAISATDGKVFVGMKNGLVIFDFTQDRVYRINKSENNFIDNIANRNTNSVSWANAAGVSTFNPNSSDTVLDIDSIDIDPNSYLAIGTSSSIELWNVSATPNTIATDTSTQGVTAVKLSSDRSIYHHRESTNSLYVSNFGLSEVTDYQTQLPARAIFKIEIAPNLPSDGNNTVYLGTDKGFTIIQEGASPNIITLSKGYTGAGVADFNDVINFGNDSNNVSDANLIIPGVSHEIQTEHAITLRFKPADTLNAASVDSNIYLAEKGDMSGSDYSGSGEYQIYFDSSANLNITLRNRNGDNNTCKTESSSWSDAQWYHLEINFVYSDPDTYVRIYVDGVLDGGVCTWSSSDTRYTNAGAESTVIGRNFRGSIDELLITTNRLNTASEFAIPTSEYPTTEVPITSCLYLYHFNETDANTAEDSCTTNGTQNATFGGTTDSPWFSRPTWEDDNFAINSFAINSSDGNNVDGKLYLTDDSSNTSILTFTNLETVTPSLSITDTSTLSGTTVEETFIYQPSDTNSVDFDFGIGSSQGLILIRN